MTAVKADDAAVHTACARIGLQSVSPSLLHRHATPIYLLEPSGIVARVYDGEAKHDRARTAVTIARWLIRQGFPATAPVEVEQPVEVENRAVTFWKFYPQHGRLSPCAAKLGAILRELHGLARTPVDLEHYRPLSRLGDALATTSELTEMDRIWLLQRRAELLSTYQELQSDLGEGLIHGDAYSGNMLWNGDQAILGDWDEVAYGPRELDLANTHHGIRFGRSAAEREAFSEAYGWDVTTWNGFSTVRAMRDLHTLAVYIERSKAGDTAAGAELAHRVRTLRSGDTAARWHAR